MSCDLRFWYRLLRAARCAAVHPLFLAICYLCPAAVQAETNGVLQWFNGDRLPGRVVACDGETVDWQSPLLSQPLRLQLPYLKFAAFAESVGPVVSREPFRISFRNGDVIYAQLVAVDDSSLTFRSRRHGDCVVRRDMVRNLTKMDSASLIYLGPSGVSGWGTRQDRSDTTHWAANSEGHLTTNRPRSELFREIEIPGTAEIELRLTSNTNMPDFLVAFDDQLANSVRLETWLDEVVAASGDDFVSLFKMSPDTRSVELRLFWNQVTAQLTVCGKDGRRLGAIRSARPGQGKFGAYLLNTGLNLTLEKLQVSKWNGKAPQEIKAGESRVHRRSGDISYGVVQGLSADGKSVLLKQPARPQGRLDSVPLDDVRFLQFSDATSDKIAPAASLRYSDGTLLSGSIQRIEGDRVWIQTPNSEQPLVAGLDGIRRIAFLPSASSAPAELDMLLHDEGLSRGKLVGGVSPENALMWQPLGAREPSPISRTCRARIIRGEPVVARRLFETKHFPDLLFLNSRDIVPCRIASIDEDSIALHSSLGDTQRVETKHVRAVELSGSAGLRSGSLAPETWKVLSDTVVKDGGLTLGPQGAVGHRHALHANELRFKLQWKANQPAMMTVRLFMSSLEETTNKLDIAFYCAPNRLMISRQVGGNLRFSTREMLTTTQPSADIRIEFGPEALAVYANTKRVLVIPFKRTERDGSFLLFTRKIAGRLMGSVTISEISNHSGDMVSRRRFIGDETKRQALTVPRFRKQNPPQHVLIATNNDILRGRLIGLTEEDVRFESLLDTFRFDRDLLSAIVWLRDGPPIAADPGDEPRRAAEKPAEKKLAGVGEPDGGVREPGDGKPDDGDPDASIATHAGPLVRFILGGGETVTMFPTRMQGDRIEGNSPALGRCDLPLHSVREISINGFESKEADNDYSDWVLRPAVEPKFAAGDSSAGQPGSELVGAKIKDLKLPLLEGGELLIGDTDDRIYVLDFWATWCGPCVRAMPEYLRVIGEFDSDKVVFVGVNQAESPAAIRGFLTKRKLKLKVALDARQSVARSFKVEGIPHTVIVRAGKVEWMHVGYRRGAEEDLKSAIEKLIGGNSQ